MQLALVLALLLLSGTDRELLKQAEPVLKNLGSEDLSNVLKEAEDITNMVGALRSVTSAFGGKEQQCTTVKNSGTAETDGFALAPIAPIADKNITYLMTKYIAQEE